MEIILLQEVLNLGDPGNIVTVKDGYARNFILPNKLGVRKTKHSLKILENQKEEFAQKAAVKNEQYKKVMAKLEEIELLKIVTKVGEGGKLFGSVTNADIAEGLKGQYEIEIDKRQINLKDPVKNEGEYTAGIKLSKDYKKDLPFLVTGEAE
jgi:large subunit ribosomal protein L9